MTSRKAAAADYDDHLCEQTTTGALGRESTPAMLDCSQTLEKGYISGTEQLLRGDGSLMDTQLGCGINDSTSILTLPWLLHLPADVHWGCSLHHWEYCRPVAAIECDPPCCIMRRESTIRRAVPLRIRISLSRQSCGDQGRIPWMTQIWWENNQAVQMRIHTLAEEKKSRRKWRLWACVNTRTSRPPKTSLGLVKCGFPKKVPWRQWSSGYGAGLWLQRFRFYPDHNLVLVLGLTPEVQPGRRCPSSCSHDLRVNDIISGRRRRSHIVSWKHI